MCRAGLRASSSAASLDEGSEMAAPPAAPEDRAMTCAPSVAGTGKMDVRAPAHANQKPARTAQCECPLAIGHRTGMPERLVVCVGQEALRGAARRIVGGRVTVDGDLVE